MNTTLTGIAVELENKATLAALGAVEGFDTAKVLSGDANMVHRLFRGEGLAVAYKDAVDLLCDHLAQEIEVGRLNALMFNEANGIVPEGTSAAFRSHCHFLEEDS